VSLGFMQPWALLLAGFALTPWFRRGQDSLQYSSIAMLPEDNLSIWIDRGLRGAGSAAVLMLVFGIAGPYLREQWVDRMGTGAHIVLLLDRSSSMNDNFTGRHMGARSSESKSAVARDLLSEFVGRRPHDIFAMVGFAAAPIYLMPLTDDHVAIQAAIAAAGARGHGVTSMAPGLAMALDFFSGKPMTGARIILLVSDGAAQIDDVTRDRLRQWFQETRSSLYWIYLRNPTSAPLSEKPANPNESQTPEYFLNHYFQTLGVPYRAFEAENPDAMQRAISAVEALENQPIKYREQRPRQDLSAVCFAVALGLMLLLLAAKTLEVRSWHA
jgi:mxaC protein